MKQTASSWSVICTNQNSAILDIDFICPFCGETVSIEMSVEGSEYFDAVMSGSFEFDAVCSECDRVFTVECTEDGLTYQKENGHIIPRS